MSLALYLWDTEFIIAESVDDAKELARVEMRRNGVTEQHIEAMEHDEVQKLDDDHEVSVEDWGGIRGMATVAPASFFIRESGRGWLATTEF